MAGAGGRRARGPGWRARRKWAAMGWPGRIVSVVIGLLVIFIVLGAVLASCGAEEKETPRSPSPSSPSPTTSKETPGSPSPSSPSPTTSPPGVPPSRPAVTETATVTATPVPPPQETDPEPMEPTTAPPADVYYENCDAARDAGAAPVYAGEPGYGPHLDRDGDGVACEP
ncbi:excalibur calcium-binding domain-containing protein [Streptomyces bottropensis]|uniref:excalibur calcium-binding domain-containing protein n=1 Tax=Streptomyces bottropensis TaxID=42235 RepID=UPI003805EDA7